MEQIKVFVEDSVEIKVKMEAPPSNNIGSGIDYIDQQFEGTIKFDKNYDYGSNVVTEDLVIAKDMTGAKNYKAPMLRLVGDGSHTVDISAFENPDDFVFDNTNLLETTIGFFYNGRSAIVKELATQLLPDSSPLLLSDVSFSLISQIAATWNFTSNKTGDVIWGVYMSNANPSKSEILAGTGALSHGTKSVTAGATTQSLTGLSYSTDYKVFYYTTTPNSESDIESTDTFETIARTQMDAPVITVQSAGVSQLNISVDSNVNGVDLYMSTDNVTYNFYQSLNAGTTTANPLTGLSAGSTRYFKGIAKGNNTTTVDSALSQAYSGTTSNLTQLSAPTGFSATANGQSEIQLSWNNVANNSGYKIQVSTDNITFVDLFEPATNATSYNHTGLSAGQTRYYKILTKGDGITYSNSTYSSSVNATTNSASTLLPMAQSTALINDADGYRSSSGTTWGGFGLSSKYLASGADGYIEMEIPSSTASGIMMAFDANNTNKAWNASGDTYDYGVFIQAGTRTIFRIVNGSPTSLSTNSVNGSKIRINRTSGTLTIQYASDGTNFTTLYTFGTFAGNLYININIEAGTGKIFNLKGVGLS